MHHIKSICETPFINNSCNEMRLKINCKKATITDIDSSFSSPTHLNAFITILVLSGGGIININYRNFTFCPNSIILLSASHLFHFINCSPNFECRFLFVSKDFMEEMDSTDMIYRRIKYGIRLYNEPLIQLTLNDKLLINERIDQVDRAIEHINHTYYKEVILNTVFAFYLDLSDIIDRNPSMKVNNMTHHEAIVKSFIELLSIYYRKNHKVDFYASQLNLSAHHLTYIVKRITGQTVSDFIAEMLFSEARTLLSLSKLSIQEIAVLLHFADQSSFGKFFKRKAGISPADFRK